eukprot:Gb_05298 [translate_table: standard]
MPGIGPLPYDPSGVEPSTGLTSEVGYPHLGTMVRAKVPVEVVLVVPIWEHCGILSQVKVVITPSLVVRPIIAHIHILVVVEALSNWIGLEFGVSHSLVVLWNSTAACVEVGCARCTTTSVSSLHIVLGLAGVCIVLMSLTTARCLLVNIRTTTRKRIHSIGLLFMPRLFLVVPVLSVDVSSSAMQRGGSSSLSARVNFERSLITDSNISLKLLLFVGKVTVDSSHGLFRSIPSSCFINFWIELVLMSKTKGSPLARPVGAGVWHV